MPELPEVETVRRILEPIVKDETIASIKVYREKNILTGADLFVSSLIGEKFLSVSRVGKYLLFHLTNDKVIVSHLRMEGKYFERETPKEEKHDILCYVFKSGKCLVYNDVRKFGVIELYKENEIMTKSPIHKLGKEPFVMEKEELLASLFKKKKTPIKTALLDQTIIAGLGNIYVDEVCFASGLNPLENSGNVTLSDCEKIIKESRRILKEAIDLGGSTIKSYHPKEGVNGEMQN
ncbi:MAG: DNA-formamidopyrimidine glycosylase, partial [Candidatus Enteromonas sp.]|nr:DNA-formamidopyrimidine glycosylase [Candidatus Enteromonas sp.]